MTSQGQSLIEFYRVTFESKSIEENTTSTALSKPLHDEHDLMIDDHVDQTILDNEPMCATLESKHNLFDRSAFDHSLSETNPKLSNDNLGDIEMIDSANMHQTKEGNGIFREPLSRLIKLELRGWGPLSMIDLLGELCELEHLCISESIVSSSFLCHVSMPKLKSIELKDCTISAVKENSLDGFYELEEFAISDCKNEKGEPLDASLFLGVYCQALRVSINSEWVDQTLFDTILQMPRLTQLSMKIYPSGCDAKENETNQGEYARRANSQSVESSRENAQESNASGCISINAQCDTYSVVDISGLISMSHLVDLHIEGVQNIRQPIVFKKESNIESLSLVCLGCIDVQFEKYPRRLKLHSTPVQSSVFAHIIHFFVDNALKETRQTKGWHNEGDSDYRFEYGGTPPFLDKDFGGVFMDTSFLRDLSRLEDERCKETIIIDPHLTNVMDDSLRRESTKGTSSPIQKTSNRESTLSYRKIVSRDTSSSSLQKAVHEAIQSLQKIDNLNTSSSSKTITSRDASPSLRMADSGDAALSSRRMVGKETLSLQATGSSYTSLTPQRTTGREASSSLQNAVSRELVSPPQKAANREASSSSHQKTVGKESLQVTDTRYASQSPQKATGREASSSLQNTVSRELIPSPRKAVNREASSSSSSPPQKTVGKASHSLEMSDDGYISQSPQKTINRGASPSPRKAVSRETSSSSSSLPSQNMVGKASNSLQTSDDRRISQSPQKTTGREASSSLQRTNQREASPSPQKTANKDTPSSLKKRVRKPAHPPETTEGGNTSSSHKTSTDMSSSQPHPSPQKTANNDASSSLKKRVRNSARSPETTESEDTSSSHQTSTDRETSSSQQRTSTGTTLSNRRTSTGTALSNRRTLSRDSSPSLQRTDSKSSPKTNQTRKIINK